MSQSYLCREDAIAEVLYPVLGERAPQVDVDALFDGVFTATPDGFEQVVHGAAFWESVDHASR